tara:strand:- start:49 stop:504 length:456 start_codon:yes stop_codon:yes gene_type:complete
MAFVINDRVKETTTSIGTGTINLAGATVGFDSFVSGIGTTNSTYYAITVSQGVWEVGIGTVTDAATDTLSRDTVISNSSGNTSKIDFAAGEKDVFCTIPAKRTISPVMTATGYVVTHSSTLDEDQTLDSGVLAGPVTVTGTQIITGTLAIV